MSDCLHSNEKAAAFTKETGGGANSCGYFGGFGLGASTAVARRAEGYCMGTGIPVDKSFVIPLTGIENIKRIALFI